MVDKGINGMTNADFARAIRSIRPIQTNEENSEHNSNDSNNLDYEFEMCDGWVDDNKEKKKKLYEDLVPIVQKIPKYMFKIPLEIITADVTDKRIDALIYLQKNIIRNDNTVMYSWNKIVEQSGYTVLKHGYSPNNKSHICNKFKDAMNYLYDAGYILEYDSSQSNRNTFCELMVDYNKLFPQNCYGRIYDFELKYIRENLKKSKKLTSSHVLLVLAYIRVTMNHTSTKNFSDMSNKYRKEKPEVCFKYFKTIAEKTYLSTKIVTSCVEWLTNAGIIVYEQLPAMTFENKEKKKIYFKKDFTIFADCYRYKFSNYVFKKDNVYDPVAELQNGRLLLEKSRRDYKPPK